MPAPESGALGSAKQTICAASFQRYARAAGEYQKGISGRAEHMVKRVEGEPAEVPVTAWDAHALIAIGEIIRRHVAAFPPPPNARYAGDLLRWSDDLLVAGRADLAGLVSQKAVLRLVG